MSVAADCSDALDPEVEGLCWEPGGLKEGHDEAAQAAVHVQTDAMLGGKLTQCNDVVLAAIREVNCRAYDLFGPLSFNCNKVEPCRDRP